VVTMLRTCTCTSSNSVSAARRDGGQRCSA
jgi:hypothetical protein